MTTKNIHNKNIKHQLKHEITEICVKQQCLFNYNISKTIKRSSNSNNPNININEIKKLLKHDNPKGNNLRKFSGIVTDEQPIDSVEEKKRVYNRY